VLRNKLKRLLPIGVLMLATGLLLHNFAHGPYSERSAAFLIGMSAVFIIASIVGRTRSPIR
jgi:hypothetical protein